MVEYFQEPFKHDQLFGSCPVDKGTRFCLDILLRMWARYLDVWREQTETIGAESGSQVLSLNGVDSGT